MINLKHCFKNERKVNLKDLNIFSDIFDEIITVDSEQRLSNILNVLNGFNNGYIVKDDILYKDIKKLGNKVCNKALITLVKNQIDYVNNPSLLTLSNYDDHVLNISKVIYILITFYPKTAENFSLIKPLGLCDGILTSITLFKELIENNISINHLPNFLLNDYNIDLTKTNGLSNIVFLTNYLVERAHNYFNVFLESLNKIVDEDLTILADIVLCYKKYFKNNLSDVKID